MSVGEKEKIKQNNKNKTLSNNDKWNDCIALYSMPDNDLPIPHIKIYFILISLSLNPK